MGKKLDKVIGSKADRQKLKQAREALNADKSTTETDAYLAKNKAVADTERQLPWLGRW
jgi:hypothetical protein